jgi:AhpD family alkylhydroperoxidase
MEDESRLEIGPFTKLVPEIYAALGALSKAAPALGLEKDLIELVKIRASQINGCTYCLQYHINLGRQLGVEPAKIDQLAAWREARIYTPRERMALHATEALTTLAGGEIPDDEFDEFHEEFGEKGLAGLVAAIGVINVWNRFGVLYRFTPPASGPLR